MLLVTIDRPPVNATNLAAYQQMVLAKEIPAKVTWNFQGPRPRSFKQWGTTKQNRFVTLAEGTKLVRAANVEKSEFAVGYLLAGGLEGDFETHLKPRASL